MLCPFCFAVLVGGRCATCSPSITNIEAKEREIAARFADATNVDRVWLRSEALKQLRGKAAS